MRTLTFNVLRFLVLKLGVKVALWGVNRVYRGLELKSKIYEVNTAIMEKEFILIKFFEIKT